MSTNRRRVLRHRVTLTLLIAALVTGFALAATATMAPGGARQAESRGRPQGAKVTTNPYGGVTARQVDRRRGLVFEVYTSAHSDSALYITLAPGAPRATRDLITSRPLVGTCDVAGQRVREFAGHWDPEYAQYGTALLTDDPKLSIAETASSCGLWVGERGDTADVALFGKRPFSRVRLRHRVP